MVIIKALAWVLSLVAVVTWLVAHFRGATKMARTAPGRNER